VLKNHYKCEVNCGNNKDYDGLCYDCPLHWQWVDKAESPVEPGLASPEAGKHSGLPTPQETSNAPPAPLQGLGNPIVIEDLDFLYTLRDELEDTLGNPRDILDRIRDVVYERIQLKEMALWEI